MRRQHRTLAATGFLCLSLAGAPPGRAEVRQLTDNGRSDHSPALNRTGQVVWADGVVGAPAGRLYLWTGSTTRQLTEDQASVRSFQIDDAGQVVWETDRGTVSDLFLWDGAAVRQLVSIGILRSRPQMTGSG